MSKLVFESNDKAFDVVSKLQRFTYRCINMFGPEETHKYNEFSKLELMEQWHKTLFKDYNSKLWFDETLWCPEQPELYENVVMIYVETSGLGFLKHKINFNEQTHEIFHVEFLNQNKMSEQ